MVITFGKLSPPPSPCGQNDSLIWLLHVHPHPYVEVFSRIRSGECATVKRWGESVTCFAIFFWLGDMGTANWETWKQNSRNRFHTWPRHLFSDLILLLLLSMACCYSLKGWTKDPFQSPLPHLTQTSFVLWSNYYRYSWFNTSSHNNRTNRALIQLIHPLTAHQSFAILFHSRNRRESMGNHRPETINWLIPTKDETKPQHRYGDYFVQLLVLSSPLSGL